jgi:hypothetical protein
MTDCYRDASVMLQFAVALGDAFAQASEGRLGSAAATLVDRRNGRNPNPRWRDARAQPTRLHCRHGYFLVRSVRLLRADHDDGNTKIPTK